MTVAGNNDAGVTTKEDAKRRLGVFDSVVLSGAAVNVAVAAALFLYWLTH